MVRKVREIQRRASKNMHIQTPHLCMLVTRESHLQGTGDGAGKVWAMFSPSKQIPHVPHCTSALSIQSCFCSGIHAGFTILSVLLGILLVLNQLLNRKQDMFLQQRQTEWWKFIIRLKDLSIYYTLAKKLRGNIYWRGIIQMGVWLQVMRLFLAIIMLLIEKRRTNIRKKTYNGRKGKKSYPLGYWK